MAYTNINDPSAYFQAFLYTGNGSNRTITLPGNSDLKFDLYWYKQRSQTGHHRMFDTSRGLSVELYPNLTAADSSATYFNNQQANSFDIIANDSATNTNGVTFANWQWKANGGTTSSNTDGTITSTVQANTTAGFSIVTYTGNGSSNQTVGHGLGVAPDFIVVKSRNTVATTDANWIGYHKELTSSYKIQLNLSTAAGATGNWNSTSPTTSVFSILSGNGGTNASGGNFVAYCFAEKKGYSKFGKYVGNGSTNGPFVYTGFKPALIITKNADATDSWNLLDNKRSPYNVADKYLQADNANAEGTYTFYDILSNGFKIRNTGNANISGNNIIYMAFAENPFVTSTGVPTTAR